jgi:hypothetical protein
MLHIRKDERSVMSQWLIFLAILPLSCLYLTKNLHIKKRFMWNGIAFGVVVAPVSFGLIQMTYIPFVGKILGLLGVLFNLTHGSIGYISLLWSGTIEPNTAITAAELFMINIFNGVLFAYIYGLIGYAVDRKLAKEDKNMSVFRTPLHTST